jgi:carboxypeptidase T
MRANPDGELGVDLNRNCDFIFGGEGSSDETYSDTYHGPSAFSEPETTALKDFLDARPNIRTLNTFHSYAGLVMWPWGGKNGPVDDADDAKAFKAMAEAMAQMTGLQAEQSNEMYIATGDCADWAYAAHRIFAFTTELNGNSFYPGAAEIDKEAPGEIQAALYLLEYSDDPHRAASQNLAGLPCTGKACASAVSK